jgi:predicted dehydrogenase
VSLNVGLIGAGGIAQTHLPAYTDNDALNLTAVCDVDSEAADDVATEVDAETWVDFERLVEETSLDAVDVTLPHNLHYPAVKAALEADLHVHVEKPFAISMAECRELVALAAERDRRLMVGQQQRYDPHHRGLKERIDEGVLGTIHHARADGIQNLIDVKDPDTWLFDGEVAGGGSVISVLVHKIDLLRYYLGEAERVTALSKTADDRFTNGAEDYATVLAEFENGVQVDLFSTYSAGGVPYNEGFWLFGEDRVAHALPEEGAYMTPPRLNEPGNRTVFEEVEAAPMPTRNATVNELLHFADCIDRDTEPISSGRDNLGTMAVVFAIYESANNDGAWHDVDVREVE